MILRMYSVYDAAVSAYLPPFYVRAPGEAVRMFSDTVNDPKSNLNKYANDYMLCYMGEFDDGDGKIVSVNPQRILAAREVISPRVLSPDEEPR